MMGRIISYKNQVTSALYNEWKNQLHISFTFKVSKKLTKSNWQTATVVIVFLNKFNKYILHKKLKISWLMYHHKSKVAVQSTQKLLQNQFLIIKILSVIILQVNLSILCALHLIIKMLFFLRIKLKLQINPRNENDPFFLGKSIYGIFLDIFLIFFFCFFS